MASSKQDMMLAEIDKVLAEWKQGEAQRGQDSDTVALQNTTLLLEAIRRVAPSGSSAVEHAERYAPLRNRAALAGILSGLRSDYAAGRLRTFSELLHASLFSDFLEMADHLLSEGYKDAAAVIAGSALEAHIRQLCEQHGISTLREEGQPKKAERMNNDLRAAGAYEKGDEKNVTAWLNLRNHAAHGEYGKYQDGEVSLLIAAVRDFIGRHPA